MRRHAEIVVVLVGLLGWMSAPRGAELGPTDATECRRLLDAREYAAAARECARSAEAGDAMAQFDLSVMYSNGWGVPHDEDVALRWLQASAERRHAGAEYALAIHYATGTRVPKDPVRALALMREAAGQNFVLAEYHLGRWYARGENVVRDTSEAVRWYRLAAERGYAPAQYLVAGAYHFGSGVNEDPAEAARWLQAAAEQGHAGAQSQLGFWYGSGDKGVPKDLVQSYKWHVLAAAQGAEHSKRALPVLTPMMSGSQVAAGRKLAEEWLAAKRRPPGAPGS